MKSFKRIFALLISIIMFSTPLCFSALARYYYPDDVEELKQEYAVLLERFENGEVTIGDADGDGAVTTSDARLTLQTSLIKMQIKFDPNALASGEVWSYSSPNILLADVDGNYYIGTTDARLILQYAVGKIKSFDRVDLS